MPMLAAKAVLLLTVPPFVIVSEPVPKLPILSPPGSQDCYSKLEPGPVTVTAPVEPEQSDRAAAAAVHRAAVLDGKRARAQAADHEGSDVRPLEPAPDTVTVPCPPGKLPINPPISVNVPPFWITSIPVPFVPTVRFSAVAPAPLISVELGVTVFMFASVATPGTPRGSQLTGLNQPLETAPVQLVWACVETVDAAKSAIVASNPDERNLQAARARDVVTPEHLASAKSDTPNDNDRAQRRRRESQDFRLRADTR